MFLGRLVVMHFIVMLMVSRIRMWISREVNMQLDFRRPSSVSRLARHGRGNRTPNREQYRKDEQKDDAKKSH